MNDKIKQLLENAEQSDAIAINKWRIENREQLREQRKKELKELMEKDKTMSNNKQSIPKQGYYFCTLITGEFFSLYYDGRNFHSQERTYKREEVKKFNKIIYEY